ncbi:ExbD/TolR family protein [Lentisalinibacter orientalis]|uniref:ExbD/TolR family protein n=1 Tax=Lentisalinibacter orientalis TaxID=2992241 RepID=UPI0038639C37
MFRKRHHYRRRTKETPELDVTTFLNLMVVLVPFLLITAVFSRLTIVELDLPSSSGGAATTEPNFRLEVIVRESGFELTNGQSVIAAIPKVEDEYDFETLSEHVVSLKQQYRSENAASVLLEPFIPYDYLIQVMDVVRSRPMEAAESGEIQLVALFPEISVGEAP